jgi:conjugative relaxase-like TrwC/TraI family protein
MLTIGQSVSAKGALRYFDQELARGDYYSEKERRIGTWDGEGAKLLGLSGLVKRQDFANLTANINPLTHEKLTLRTKENRTAGYDFTFSIPKSLSLYLAIENDNEAREMVTKSFRETMQAIESEMSTRVRGVDGQGLQRKDEVRLTGNSIWASFVHDTTRPIDGMPDPHFHIHAYILNATFDTQENRWKAGQFRDLVANKSYWEASFNARLAERLTARGFGIRRTERHFELAGVSRELIEKFSKRTQEIERQSHEYLAAFEEKARTLAEAKDISRLEAKRLLLGDPAASPEKIKAQVLSEVGAKSRESKSKGEKDPQKRLENWKSQMTQEQLQSLSRASVLTASHVDLLMRQKAQDLAISESFERYSVATRKKIASLALRRGVGTLSVREADHFTERDTRLIGDDKRVTTQAVLAEERQSIEYIRAGKNTLEALDRHSEWIRQFPSPTEHQAAIGHLLTTRDQFSLIQGRAGTGKTTLMNIAVNQLEKYGRQSVAVFAPSSAAVEVLRAEGFEHAETFQMLEKNRQLQEKSQGSILWVDEAGFLSAKQMAWLTDFARANGSRVILSGDSAQHHAVERGDALRVLEAAGALQPQSLTEIFRQRDPELRAIVKNLSDGFVDRAVDRLIEQNRLVEIEEEPERSAAIVDKHLEGVLAGKSSLIVAPTHEEGRAITIRVREALRASGFLAGNDIDLVRLQNTGWTDAQRADAMSYKVGQVIEFQQAGAGFAKDQQWNVSAIDNGTVTVSRDGHPDRILPLEATHRFAVYDKERLALAVGDAVRITKNHFYDLHRFINNDVLRVASIDGQKITLNNGKVMNANALLHLDQGHVVTSHASQGKTVDQVLVSVPIDTFNLVNTAQFYVSISRARETALVYTESASALREAVAENIHSRLSALELTGEIERPKRAERTAKPDVKKQRGQKAQDTKRDKALLAELYKTGRLRPAKEPALQSETLQRLLIVLQDQEREKFEPTLLRRLAALSRQAESAEYTYNRSLSDYVRSKTEQIERIETKLESWVNRIREKIGAGIVALRDRLKQLENRLNAVQTIKEDNGLYNPKVNELAEDKLRQDQPELAKRRDDALRLKREKILNRGRDKELVQTLNQER